MIHGKDEAYFLPPLPQMPKDAARDIQRTLLPE
jgi:hypothetical protein